MKSTKSINNNDIVSTSTDLPEVPEAVEPFTNKKSPIDTIYEEREKFIIIGLTGRTGSGCTTVSSILSTANFDNLNLHQPKNTDFDNNDQRKYQIIYRYAQRHWEPFKTISMTDIIFSFILFYDFTEFENLIREVFSESSDSCEMIVTEIKKSNSFVKRYKLLYNDINRVKDQKRPDRFVRPHNASSKKDLLVAEKECKILRHLGEIKNQIYGVLKNHTYKYEVERNGEKKTEKANAYTYFLQEIGNRIRHHGSVLKEGEFTGEHMYAIAQRANDFIKAYNVFQKSKKQNTLICLEAIRNPYEATYFQDRYASFYLVSVSTDNEERLRRLGKNLDFDQISTMDQTEYPKKLKGDKQFTNQNIGACAQLADIYIYNPREDTEEKYFVSELIVKYIMLIKHPGLVTPSSVERCMQIAYNAKLNSGCLSRQVGAVITDKFYSVKAVGWNSVAEGQVPCNLRSVDNYLHNKDQDSFSTYEIEDPQFSEHINDVYGQFFKKNSSPESFKGRLFSYCFKDEYEEITKQKNQVHTRSLHAEENAFLQLAKYGGEGIMGGNLFTSASSCVLCSKKAYQLGIRHIYYIDPYTDIANSHILSFGKDKSKCPQCHLFYGAIGRAYTCLFTQRIAIKDELNILLEAEKHSRKNGDNS